MANFNYIALDPSTVKLSHPIQTLKQEVSKPWALTDFGAQNHEDLQVAAWSDKKNSRILKADHFQQLPSNTKQRRPVSEFVHLDDCYLDFVDQTQ